MVVMMIININTHNIIIIIIIIIGVRQVGCLRARQEARQIAAQ